MYLYGVCITWILGYRILVFSNVRAEGSFTICLRLFDSQLFITISCSWISSRQFYFFQVCLWWLDIAQYFLLLGLRYFHQYLKIIWYSSKYQIDGDSELYHDKSQQASLTCGGTIIIIEKFKFLSLSYHSPNSQPYQNGNYNPGGTVAFKPILVYSCCYK